MESKRRVLDWRGYSYQYGYLYTDTEYLSTRPFLLPGKKKKKKKSEINI